jgi:hypothetical protein
MWQAGDREILRAVQRGRLGVVWWVKRVSIHVLVGCSHLMCAIWLQPSGLGLTGMTGMRLLLLE